MMKKYHTKESYKHKYAKELLKEWLKDKYIRITEEEKFSMNGHLEFIPDLTCYTNEGVKDLYEIVHKNEVIIFKQWRMWIYFNIHKWENINVYRVEAEWVLSQIAKPRRIKKMIILQT